MKFFCLFFSFTLYPAHRQKQLSVKTLRSLQILVLLLRFGFVLVPEGVKVKLFVPRVCIEPTTVAFTVRRCATALRRPLEVIIML